MAIYPTKVMRLMSLYCKSLRRVGGGIHFTASMCVLFRENWAISSSGYARFGLWGRLKVPGLQVFDRGFRFQQDGDAVANGVNALALIALQGVVATQHERLPADGAGENLEQFGANHDG